MRRPGPTRVGVGDRRDILCSNFPSPEQVLPCLLITGWVADPVTDGAGAYATRPGMHMAGICVTLTTSTSYYKGELGTTTVGEVTAELVLVDNASFFLALLVVDRLLNVGTHL